MRTMWNRCLLTEWADMHSQESTCWRNIVLAMLAALIAAFQIGKAIIALPLLLGEPLHLDLREAGLVLSSLAIVGAVLAMPLGLLISRYDARRLLCAGLAIIALTSFAGAYAVSVGVLLAARVIEGVAVVMLFICASSFIGSQAASKDRDLAMAVSSTAVPGGIALVIFGATLALSVGVSLSWTMLWQVNAWLALVCGFALWFGISPTKKAATSLVSEPAGGSCNHPAAIRRVTTTRGAQCIALCFSLYAIFYFAFSGFLPLLLHDLLALSQTEAGYVSAVIVASNVAGNLTAGALMRRGVASRRIVSSGFVLGAVCVSILFWLAVPVAVSIMLAMLMVGGMGAIPGALTAVAPKVAPSATLVAPTIGFMLQGSYIGQLIGPVASGSLAQAGGWTLVAWMLLLLALVGAALGRKL